MDPVTTPTPTPPAAAPDPAPAAPAATAPTSEAPAPTAAPPAESAKPSLDEQLAEALDKGIAEASGTPAPAPEKPDAPAEPAKPDAAKPDASKDAPLAAATADKAKPADEDPEHEIVSLGLKERAAERFRGMHAELKELRPLKTALEQAGIKDLAQAPRLADRAKAADQWEELVTSTGANPQQMGMAFDYLRLINAGTPESLTKAYEVMQGELQVLAKALGREAPGVYDPLAEHADLQQAVDAGEITRKHALEVAQARHAGKLTTAHTEQQRQQQEHTQASERGRVALNTLGEQLKAADPDYERKLPFLLPVLKRIRATMPPERWAEEVRAAYAEIPALPPVVQPAPAAPARPPVGHVPLRPTGSRADLQRQFTDPLEALEAGIAAANEMGGG